MGQYWNLINIDHREAMGNMGKLGEFFWYASRLVDRLMPLRLSEKYESDIGSLEEIKRKAVTGLVDRDFQIHNLTVLPKNRDSSTSALLTLPIELLLLIIEDLGKDYLNLLCFSMTCTLLWELSGKARYDSLSSELDRHRWAGCRIILLGDYAGTLPPSMLSAQDIEELGLGDSQNQEIGSALYEAARDFDEPSLNQVSPLFANEKVRANMKLRKELERDAYTLHFGHWICFTWENFILPKPEGDRWMVRNLSKRQYMTKSSKRYLTQMIYCLIGRSDDPSVSMPGGDWLIRGPWAGDRIDITLVSIHEEEHGNEKDQWKDITDGVMQKLRDVSDEEDREDEFSD
ncbi:hypothetical protein C8R42DRAFT_181853 [Lentinula raphanica]|nr:hypothetical protein C8R42DRAFT_181853 [Lentinula raphanica]